jgi:hypothetical protein
MQEIKEPSDIHSSNNTINPLIADYQRRIEPLRQELMRGPLFIPPMVITTEAQEIAVNIGECNITPVNENAVSFKTQKK